MTLEEVIKHVLTEAKQSVPKGEGWCDERYYDGMFGAMHLLGHIDYARRCELSNQLQAIFAGRETSAAIDEAMQVGQKTGELAT